MNTYHIYQDYTGNFCTAVQLRNSDTKDRYINAGDVSGKIRCRWTGYTIEARTRKEAFEKYDEGDY